MRVKKGQAVVELALLMPVLLLLLAGLLDVGRAYAAQVELNNAVREGANALARNPDNAALAVQRVVAEPQGALVINPSNVTTQIRLEGYDEEGRRLRSAIVSASCELPLILGSIFGFDSMTLSSTVTFMVVL